MHQILMMCLLMTDSIQINARLGKICSQPTEDSKQAALVYEMFNIAKVHSCMIFCSCSVHVRTGICVHIVEYVSACARYH